MSGLVGPARTVDCAVLLLDLDGTLVDSADAVLRGWQAWTRSVGLPAEGLAELVHGRSAASTITTLLPDVTDARLRRHIQYVLTFQERDPDPARPMPGAAELVSGLGPEQWAVVTGCSAGMATARLAAGGLPRPRVLVTDEDVSRGKPDPDGYLLALQRLGITAGEALAVEDAPAGVAAARAAGITTVAVTSTHPAAQLTGADVVVDDLSAIRPSRRNGRLTVAFGETVRR
jgi:mannitol-1-/sugar-/sorbitol-6-phosphatase